MLTGRPCFHGDSVTDVLAAVVRAEPDWTALPSETPARVRDLLRRCLTKDRRERLQSIGDARIEIRDYLAAPPLAGGSENIRPKPHADGRRREHAYLALAAALALAVLALAAGWWHAAQPVSHPVVQLDVDLGPDYHGSDLSLSPDGTHIVYAGRGLDGKYGCTRARSIGTSPSRCRGPRMRVSRSSLPTGSTSGSSQTGKLKKTSVDGGGAAVLCEAPEPRGGSWGVDGTIIAALRVNAGLSRVSSDGGAVQPATELMRERKEVTHRWPQVLPGAEVVVFTVHTATGGYEEATIQAQSLRTGERRTLVQGGYFGRVTSSGHLLYVRQGVLYAAPMDVRRLALTGPATPVVDRVSSNPLQGSAPLDVTWSGTLVYVRSKMATPATLLWLDRAGLTQPFFRAALMLPPPPPVLTAAVGDLSPRFSPDGTRLALSMMVDGNLDVWVYRHRARHYVTLDVHAWLGSFAGVEPQRQTNRIRVGERSRAEELVLDAGGWRGRSRPADGEPALTGTVFVLAGRETAGVHRRGSSNDLGPLDAPLGRRGQRPPETREARATTRHSVQRVGATDLPRWEVAGVSVGRVRGL